MTEDEAKKRRTAKLSVESYKGVRDFYPEEKFVHNYILETMRLSAESFGFQEYDASLLEPTKLYEAKTGEEIVHEQTYTFEDRGGRSVTLRPEMTPSLARMIAKRRRELSFPLRWYSVPNVFRYERPQRGRLREHWQLNADIFGAEGVAAEVEIITLAWEIMRNAGADETDFEIRLSYAGLLHSILKKALMLSDTDTKKLIRIVDMFGKISDAEIRARMKEAIGEAKQKRFEEISRPALRSGRAGGDGGFDTLLKKRPEFSRCQDVMKALREVGVEKTAITFELFLARGFDYYTGIIFEVFDTSPYNKRALFGGGRYDNLLDVFGVPPVPAVGFGMGDVAFRDFLETHDLLPDFSSTTDLFLATVDAHAIPKSQRIAQALRREGLTVAVNVGSARVGNQLTTAHKQGIPFAITVGEKEIRSKKYPIKNLATKEEQEVKESEIAEFIFQK